MPFTLDAPNGGGFDLQVIDSRPQQITFRGPRTLFADEAGGHRWQRVPPTEKRGRVQTSTVTVAVLPEPDTATLRIPDSDIVWEATKGSGAGGQHRNTTMSAVKARHVPTGIEAKSESERSQHSNRAEALAVLRARVWEHLQQQQHRKVAADRRSQVGSGQRGDKRRTIRVRDNQVNDHVTGQKWRYDDYVAGNW